MEEGSVEQDQVEASGVEEGYDDEDGGLETEESTPTPTGTTGPSTIHSTTPEPLTTISTRSSLISTTESVESTSTASTTSTSTTTTTDPQRTGRPNGFVRRVNNVVPSFDFEDVSLIFK